MSIVDGHISHLMTVNNGIPVFSLDEGLQSAMGRLQPFRQAFGRRHALGIKCPEPSFQRPTQAIQCRLALRRLILCFCREALDWISPSCKNYAQSTAV